MIESLIGKVLTSVKKGDYEITFTAASGHVYRMDHDQDCCESVYIESIYGDLEDLVGSPIIRAEERVVSLPDDYGLSQATFYEISTAKGGVNIRWHGSSNGYYGVSVDFSEIAAPSAEKTQDAVQMVANLVSMLRRSNGVMGVVIDSDECEELANALDTVLGAVKVD